MKRCNCKNWIDITKHDHDDNVTLITWNGRKLLFNYCPWCGKKLKTSNI